MTYRRRRATLALCLLMMRTMAGCHSYAPVSGAAPATGARVHVRFAEPRSVAVHLAGGQTVIRTSVREVVGTLKSADRDIIRLSELEVVHGLNAAGPVLSEYDYKSAVTETAAAGSTLRVEKFSFWRTASLVGLGGLGLAAALYGLGRSGSGSSAGGY